MTNKRNSGRNQIDAGYCLFGAQSILPLISQLESEIDGVKIADDIEYVHRCRVASRRIRAALPIYRDCIPQKEFRKWKSGIRDVTKSLGEARDADVQAEFLEGFIREHNFRGGDNRTLFTPEIKSSEDYSSLSGSIAENTAISKIQDNSGDDREPEIPVMTFVGRVRKFFRKFSPAKENLRSVNKNTEPESDFAGKYPVTFDFNSAGYSYLPGLECLKTRICQKRDSIQPNVIKSMEKFESSGVLEEMKDYFHEISVQGQMYGHDIHSPYSYEQAFLNISLRLEDLFWHEKHLFDPDRTEEHHMMRIYAKKLRYTMESYGDLYPDGLKPQIKAIKKLQDFLGDIHDCDVWSDFLPEFKAEEERRSVEYFGNDSFFKILSPGIDYLCDDRIGKRKELHSGLVDYWNELEKEKFWDELRSEISLPLQNVFSNMAASGDAKELKIALIGDIHANLPALEATLADIKERGATIVINAGDIVGYGAFPDEVITLIRENHLINISGNYDLAVLKAGSLRGKKKRKRNELKKQNNIYNSISSSNRKFLRTLPKRLDLVFGGKKIHISHGDGKSPVKAFTENSTKAELLEAYKFTKADIIVTGHSHKPFARETDGRWFINTGSVGMPKDGDPRASYALLTLNPFSLYHIRVPYDFRRSVDAIYEDRLSESYARIYRGGNPVDIIRHSGGDEN
jgi:putative phosphoesterase